MNYGYIHSPAPSSAWMFGAVKRPVLSKERDFTKFLPTYETQIGNGFDSMSCVSFAALNNLELLLLAKYGLVENWSDRFTAKMSGTTRQGNTFWNVAESIRKDDGIVQEPLWPKAGTSFDEYMSPVPSEVKKIGIKSLDLYEISYEFVTPDVETMFNALQYGPLEVAVYAWNRPLNGVYTRTHERGNHAVTLFRADYGKAWYVYDHYDQSGNAIKKLSWDFLFWGAISFDLTLKNMSKFKIAKQEDGKGYAIIGEATEEKEFLNVCNFLGVPIPTKDGGIDWANVKHEAMYHKV